MIRRIACLTLLALLGAGDARAEALKELNFGVIATDSSAAIKQRYELLFRDLEQALGLPVRLFYTSDYAGMIQAMRFSKVQIARYGNKSAAEAVDGRGRGRARSRSARSMPTA
jgi:phosphonate transport system substrate-binding protein